MISPKLSSVTGALFLYIILSSNFLHAQSSDPIPGGCGVVGPNLVVNPEFDLDSAGFFSAFNYRSDYICNWGDFRIANSVEYTPGNPCFGGDFNLRTIWSVTERNDGPAGKFMIVDPCDFSGSAPCTADDPSDTRIWEQTIDVCPFTEYTFSVYAKNLYATDVLQYPGASVTPLFSLSMNDVPVSNYYVDGVFFDTNPTYTIPQDLYADSAQWYQISGRISIPDTTKAKLSIRNIRLGKDGNDLAIDGVFFGLCGQAVSLNIQNDIPQCTTNGSVVPVEFEADLNTQSSGWEYYQWKKDGVVRSSGPTIAVGAKDSIPSFMSPIDNGNYFGSYELVVFPDLDTVNSCGTTSESVTILDSCLTTFPVELLRFSATAKGSVAELKWETATELNNRGFEIMISSDGASYESIGFVEGAGNSQTVQNYQFTTDALTSGKYLFMLRQMDFNGASELSQSVEVLIENQGIRYTVRPNPAKDLTYVYLSVAQNDFVQVNLYSALGQKVKTVLNREIADGDQLEIPLSTQDLAEGVYLLRIRSQHGVYNERLVIRK
ncbi:MAG: T9SS type A sorting domain-containing protein [Bacteroidota bacterium]